MGELLKRIDLFQAVFNTEEVGDRGHMDDIKHRIKNRTHGVTATSGWLQILSPFDFTG